MEEFLNQTRGFLGLMQSIMTEEEKQRSQKAADEMYEKIRLVVDDKDLNIREMLNASIAIQATVIEIALKQMEDQRKDA